jgi:Domain of unknown function (DUF1995)
MGFIAAVCCSNSRRGSGRVPRDAENVCQQLRVATHTALAYGHRNMLVDVLVEAMRRTSRTYDSEVHGCVVECVCQSLKPALRPECPSVLLVVPGSRAALDAQQYFTKSLETAAAEQQGDSTMQSPPRVEIDVLGGRCLNDTIGAVVIVDPPGKGKDILELRKLVRSAAAAQCPVVVLNLPQQGSLHEIAKCSGSLPLELALFHSVYTIAPFALRVTTAGNPRRGAGRFVYLHSFPGEWQLWRVRERESANEDNSTPAETRDAFAELLSMGASQNEKRDEYELVTEWSSKPSEQSLLSAVKRAGIGESLK